MRGFSFASNFEKLTFERLFSLNFLSKSPWCSKVLPKFDSYNLQHCKKNSCKLVFWVFTEQLNYQILNGHSTSNPHRFDVDITSIRGRPNFDEFPRHFRVLFRCNFDGRKIHVVSTYFFRCNFAGRKIHVVSTYFFRCNFDGRKIHVVSTYFFRCNFDGRKIHLASTYFFRCNFFRRNIHGVSTYFFRRNFDGRIIHFVCTYFFRQYFDEFDVVVGKL